MQFPTSSFQCNESLGTCQLLRTLDLEIVFWKPRDFPSKVQSKWIFRIQRSPINFYTMQIKSYSIHVCDLYLYSVQVYGTFKCRQIHRNDNIKCQKKWRPWWSLNSIQGIAAWKITKIGYFPFNKAGKNEFPLNHWCDTCNFSGVLNLFIENGKLPTRKFSGLDFLHWEWLEKAAPISPFLA